MRLRLSQIDIRLLQDWPCHAMWPERSAGTLASELAAIPEEAMGKQAEAFSPAHSLIYMLGLESLRSSAMAKPLGEPACPSG